LISSFVFGTILEASAAGWCNAVTVYVCLLLPHVGCVQVASDSIAAKLKVRQGALLSAVTAGSAAAAAGLLPTRRGLAGVLAGDVITALDGKHVLNGGGLFNALEQQQIGQEVTLAVTRTNDNGSQQELSFKVKLEAEK
jgi:S1-C subfamily serine protease